MAKLPQFEKRTEFVTAVIPKMDKVKGSILQGIAYDFGAQVLTAHMVKGGNVYQYSPITEEIYDALYENDSMGRAMREHVIDKPGITCTQIAKNYTA